ncbi:MAG: C-type lectin domain-containing protein [Phycisphaerales bacterium]|nr:C-type lectin domain-containing protein [Phycisphaerales bacterium]
MKRCLAIILLAAAVARGDIGERCWVPDVFHVPAVCWSLEEGGNGHWYAAILKDGPISWMLAEAEAEARGGTLATIHSAAENDFVFGLIDDDIFWLDEGPWIGLMRPSGGAMITGNWHWADSAPYGWTLWYPPYPTGGILVPWSGHFSTEGRAIKAWKNSLQSPQAGTRINSYVMEWEDLPDCNGNGIDDWTDVLMGTSEDVDGNLEPDECQCLPDIDGTGVVDVVDVLVVLARWGESGTEADINMDGIVDVNDLLIVIDAWGECAFGD